MPAVNEEDEGGVNLDDVYDQIGQFGTYQLCMLIFISLSASLLAIPAYANIFMSAQPDFRCKIPGYENDTYEVQSSYHQSLIDKYIPTTKGDTTCKIKVYNSSIELDDHYLPNNDSFKLESCNEYVYSKKYYNETIVTKWNLVCDREDIKSTFTSLYFFGYFGVLVVGLLADTFGRKIISYVFIVISSFLLALTAFILNVNSIPQSTQMIMYGILRFAVGASTNLYANGLVLIVELVGSKWRVTAANSMYYMFVLGELFVLTLAYFYRDYRSFNIGLAALSFIFVCYYWIVPESPRFLILKGKRKEAYKIFARIARSNKREFNEETFNSLIPETTPEHQAKEKNLIQKLFTELKSGTFRIRLFVTMINWLCNTFVYDGISINIGVLGGDPYLNYLYSSCIELTGAFMSHVMLQRFGRKLPYSISLCLAGLSLISITFVPQDLSIAITILALMGKFFITITFNGVYVVTAESYPTEIRNTAISLCSAQARIGGVIAPYIQLLGSQYWFPLPFIIYGSSALIAALTYVIFIPETKNAKLSDRIEQLDD